MSSAHNNLSQHIATGAKGQPEKSPEQWATIDRSARKSQESIESENKKASLKTKSNSKIITSIGNYLKKLKSSRITGGNVEWHSHCGKQSDSSSKRPSNSIPKYTGESKTHVHTKASTLMFRAVLFITAKKWKQPKYSSTDECITKCGIIY